MSLRVLLADESASIRKVFQMGLQDYGAEVKSVPSGLDVIEVAQSFQPHIIFADILLQKKNGYEVCEDIRQHPQLQNIPVILMWSSFMELDQKKYQASGAQGELEKPFDVENMRKLIQSQVQYTQSQQISHFLNFPASIKQEFIEDEKKAPQASSQASAPQPTPPQPLETTPEAQNFTASQSHSPASPPSPETDHEAETPDPNLDLDLDFNFEIETPEEEESPQSAAAPSTSADTQPIQSPVTNLAPETSQPSTSGPSPSPDEDIMGRVPTTPEASFEAPAPEEEDEVESHSVFNRQVDLDESESQEPAPEPFSQVHSELGDEEPWAVKPLHSAKTQNTPPNPPPLPQDESDEFQSMDLHKPSPPMSLDDFLYKPESAKEPEHESTSSQHTHSNPIRQVQISGSVDTTTTHTISPEEAEAILRQEARQMIQAQLSQELKPTLERIIREELNKILQEEMERERSQRNAAPNHE